MFKKNGVLLANEKIDIQKSSYITNNNIQKECLKFSISALEEEYTLSFMAEVNHDKIINFPHRFIDFGKYLFDDVVYKENTIIDTKIKNNSNFKIMRVFDDIFILKIKIDKYDVNIKIIFDLSNYISKNYGDVVLA